MNRTLVRIACVIVMLIGLGLGLFFMSKATAKQADYSARLSEAEAELAQAQSDRDALDPTTETGAAAWEEWKSGALTEGQDRLQKLENENAELDGTIKDKEKQLEGILADEDVAYNMAICDSMAEGMEKVEEHIEESK